MSEMAIMDIVKIFLGFLLIGFMISVAVFLFQLQSANNFKQHVNYQIERNGGLTEQAVADINEYSDSNFNGKFRVTSDQIYQKVKYGETVDYIVVGSFDIVMMPMPEFTMDFAGTGVSQVR